MSANQTDVERAAIEVLSELLNRPGKLDEAEVRAVMLRLEQQLGPYPWSVPDPTAPCGLRNTEAEEVRFKLGARRMKERLSSSPWYAERARKSGEKFWEDLYGSCIRW